MVAGHTIDVAHIAEALAGLVRDEPAVRELWARVDNLAVELLLVTEPIDFDTELHLYRVTEPIYDLIPDIALEVSVINPRMFRPFRRETVIRPGAQRFPLH